MPCIPTYLGACVWGVVPHPPLLIPSEGCVRPFAPCLPTSKTCPPARPPADPSACRGQPIQLLVKRAGLAAPAPRQPLWEDNGILKVAKLGIDAASAAAGAQLVLQLPRTGACSSLEALMGGPSLVYSLSDAVYEFCPSECFELA